MAELGDLEKETIHGLQELSKVLDQGWPGVDAWNRAVTADRDITNQQIRVYVRRGQWKK